MTYRDAAMASASSSPSGRTGYLATIGFEQGAREIVAWHDEHPARQRADARLAAVMDKLIETYGSPRQPPRR